MNACVALLAVSKEGREGGTDQKLKFCPGTSLFSVLIVAGMAMAMAMAMAMCVVDLL